MDVEVIFATGSMPRFANHHFSRMLGLKAFAEPLIPRDVTLVSAWGINAIPIPEMCLSQILLSSRGYSSAIRGYRDMQTPEAEVFPRAGDLWRDGRGDRARQDRSTVANPPGGLSDQSDR